MDNIERFTKKEEIMNAVLHGLGFALALIALPVLIYFAERYGDARFMLTVIIYASTLILLYLSSTLYHSFPKGKVKDLFEKFDHCSIYLLIAGTYTPLTLITLKGPIGYTLFGIVWGLALCGIIFKIFWIKKFMLLSTLLYIGMGWLIVFAIQPLLNNINSTSLVFLVAGGLWYTVGTIFYVWRRMKYHHAIWHAFVLFGSICHFFSIFFLLPH